MEKVKHFGKKNKISTLKIVASKNICVGCTNND
jgi:hypothetical protein